MKKMLEGPRSPSKFPGKFPELVFRGDEPCQSNDRWMKRIVDLADGRSIENICRLLYLEELKSGAGLTDIGLWRNMFDQEVTTILKAMSERGYIRLNRPTDGDPQCQPSPT